MNKMKSTLRTFSVLLKAQCLGVLRNKTALGLSLLFPLAFVAVFGLAFDSGGDVEASPVDIVIINGDQGIPQDVIAFGQGAPVTGDYYSDAFIETIESVTYTDSDIKIFEAEVASLDEIDDVYLELERREIAAVIELPADFSLGMLAAYHNSYADNATLTLATQNWANYPDQSLVTSVSIEGDMSLQDFSIASASLDGIVSAYFALGEIQVIGGELDIVGTHESDELTAFDRIAPGLFVFGVLMNVATTTTVALRDVQTGILERMRLTKTSPNIYVMALIASQIAVCFVQLPILFGTAVAFGFPFSYRLISAFLVVMFLSIAGTGISFIIAAVVKDYESAGSLSLLVSVPICFLADAFFPVNNPSMISESSYLGGNSLGFFDLLAPTPAVRILRSVLFGGYSLTDNAFDVILLIVLSMIYITIGVVIYSKKHFKAR